jgi:hypothetical protein
MHIEKITHQSYRTSVVVAIVLSGMVVTLAAFLGRGTLKLKAALALDEPTDVTVIALMENKLPSDVKITSIDFLREETDPAGGKPTYAYHVAASDQTDFFLRLFFNKDRGEWEVTHLETLHAESAAETQPPQ